MSLSIILRAGRAALTLLVIVTSVFIVLRSSGDAAMQILSADASSQALEQFRSNWGLDASPSEQYMRYLQGLLHGDFGASMRDGRPAGAVLLERIPATLTLTIPALVLELLFGALLGLFAALKHNEIVDRVIVMFAMLGHAIPTFVLALVAVLIFSLRLQWLPSSGSGTINHAVLPIAVLALSGSAVIARYVRSAILEIINQPYIRAAISRGMPTRQLVTAHLMPNAAVPIVALIGLLAGHILAGAIVVETMFAWPGMGQLLVNSVISRDSAVVLAILIVVGVTMIIANLLVDILCGIIDPRYRLARER
ncbi:ABC transporter permease [Rhizobium leguminosarum]|uniref:ABC transporter permease n=1 Tax=Rhizobium leguminosarum TaxID=384 RepID=UPI001C96A99E|nr:ABC transporter permease [Rhizobium leguminosarum]MBY5361909.1 ABC transporter permease [Rhizobium leguminosarum]MBY5664939.1 ABC transporter permease [Rhizobium leguminosarum]MBY5677577.1 ABC transporter permease [Rhizobium leguminosarum]